MWDFMDFVNCWLSVVVWLQACVYCVEGGVVWLQGVVCLFVLLCVGFVVGLMDIFDLCLSSVVLL